MEEPLAAPQTAPVSATTEAPDLKALFRQYGLDRQLAEVERTIRELIQPQLKLIELATRHVVEAGGKRLRAALALLSAAAAGTPDPLRARYAAAAVELVHTASLVHDDLIDNAARRRGRITVHRRWDHEVALIAGDYLFALSARAMAMAPDRRVVRYLGEASARVCEGEIYFVEHLVPLELAREEYYFKIGGKTAALFQAACQAGAACADADEATVERLGEFGWKVGLAFQIVDDILDYVGSEAELGKPAGGDLRNGLITLPLIYAAAVDGHDGFFQELIDREEPTEEEIREALRRVQALGAIEACHREAESLCQDAIQILHEHIPASPARELLEAVARFVYLRRF